MMDDGGCLKTKKSPASHEVKTGPNERRKWYLLESNQGHMDFQSIALPPELRYHLLVCGCKGSVFMLNLQIFLRKNVPVSEKRCIFAPSLRNEINRQGSEDAYRDVAQLVAHYVRDVGVGRSSRLIPTSKKRLLKATSFYFYQAVTMLSL